MRKITAHMICHTHWDREWYLTREVFRTKLVRLVDKVLDIIDSTPDYSSFMMDGQTIVLRDYLEIRPENKERLENALKSHRIFCGPWYVLPDELLISGESHIRNYIIGTSIASQYGGHMNVAYLPDSFGHPEQMPQIIKGLGMDTMVFWRGTSNSMKKSEFYWQSPCSGSKVLCVHMPYGYGNSARLDLQSAARLEDMIQALRERSNSDILLLMNGSDHITAQDDIVQIIDHFNNTTNLDAEIRLSDLETFIGELKGSLDSLETFSGELRYGDRSMLLGGTISSRMNLKQRNHTVQKKMERYLEPVESIQRLMGIETSFSGYNSHLWRKILENQPHDSICGCSVDEVHHEMITRFDCVKQLEDELFSQSIAAIGKRFVMQRPASAADAHSQWEACSCTAVPDVQLLLFEPAQDGLSDYVELEIDLDSVLVQHVDYSKSLIVDTEDSITHPDMPEELVIYDESGRRIEHVILSCRKAYYKHLQDETLPEIYKTNRVKAGLLLPSFTYGIHLLNVYKADKLNSAYKKPADNEVSPRLFAMENEYYSISFNYENGCLDVLDKKTGRLHTGVHKFVDKGDAGDEYTYSWPLNDKTYGLVPENAVVALTEKADLCKIMTIKGSLDLPEQLSDDRKRRSDKLVSCGFQTEITLYKGLDRIDFHTVFDNMAKDHRLQVEFPCGVLAEKSSASGAFGVTQRDIKLTIPENWVEYPQSTHPNHGFADVGTDEYGLSMAALGLTEYEAENVDGQSYMRLTLLRCVGWLSRTDLLTRAGNGGWTIETPDAQCLGSHEFDYSITYHAGSWQKSGSYALCDRRIHGIAVQQLRGDGNKAVLYDNPLDFLSSLPGSLRISAVKPSENGKGIILRLFNISGSHVKCEIKLPGPVTEVYSVNLKEDRLKRHVAGTGVLSIEAEPYQIITYELEVKQ